MDNTIEESQVFIPYTQLSPEALDGVIENYVLREGTDYGQVEQSYDDKKNCIIKQLEKGDVLVAFDTISETCSLILKA